MVVINNDITAKYGNTFNNMGKSLKMKLYSDILNAFAASGHLESGTHKLPRYKLDFKRSKLVPS